MFSSLNLAGNSERASAHAQNIRRCALKRASEGTAGKEKATLPLHIHDGSSSVLQVALQEILLYHSPLCGGEGKPENTLTYILYKAHPMVKHHFSFSTTPLIIIVSLLCSLNINGLYRVVACMV